jgi:putative ABC transport system permease protein
MRRLLFLLLPRDAGVHQHELDEQFEYCVRRERARLGRLGVPYAWARLVLDVVMTSLLLRRDAWRQRRINHLGAQVTSGDSIMIRLREDIRYSVRVLLRSPGFSVAVVIALGLAIGATTSVFTVVNAVLLKSLPFRDPSRLVMVFEEIQGANLGPNAFSAPDFMGFQERARSFDGLAAYTTKTYELSGVDQPERVPALRASAALFDVLGAAPVLGRAFTREEDEGRIPVVVLSDGLWRRSFGADPSVIGRAVMIDRRAYTVVGVMPRTFVFPGKGPLRNNEPADLFVPISFTRAELNGFASSYNNSVIGRLKPDVTLQQADADTRAVVARLVNEVYPAPFRDGGFRLAGSVSPLRTETVGRVESLLEILFVAVMIVLLIACADVASLMLTRAVARSREVAVRSALGAGRAQLARQVLTEAALLSIGGGVLGVLVAYASTATIARVAPPTIPRLDELALDWRVMTFAIVVSMLTALACGCLPALELSRRPSADALKDGGRSGTAGRRQKRLFGALVAAQFALAVVLLVAGGLLIRSFNRLTAVDPGFRSEQVITLATSLPALAYPDAQSIRSFYQRLLEQLESLPGVKASAASTDLPLSIRERRAFTIENPPASESVSGVTAHHWVVGQYFEALGITLRRGRFLSREDTGQSEPVAVINEALAKAFWADQDPLGQRIAFGGAREHGPWMRIVGIVADVKQGPLGTPVVPQTYTPWLQTNDGLVAENVVGVLRALTVVVRTDGDPVAVAGAIQAKVRAIDASLPIARARTMEEVVHGSLEPQRFNTVLLAAFAAVAVMLAGVGIAGVLATAVSRRTQEIGVRMALGAARPHVLRMIIRQGMALVLAGLAVGVPAAFLAARFMSSLLFGVGPRDALSFVGATALLLAVALVACYLPARRATRVDPMVALRWE